MNLRVAKGVYAAMAVCFVAAPCIAQTTARVSVSSAGVQADAGGSSASSISGDGRYVAFVSYATNLVSNDTNGLSDVFVYDSVSKTTIRASVSSDDEQSNDGSLMTAISADGRFVAFASLASNLVRGDSNFAWDVFVRDLMAETTTRVSVDSAGGQAEGNSGLNDGFAYAKTLSVSGDGRFVAFSSSAADLVPGDTNGKDDVFVYDQVSGATTRVSYFSGIEANDNCSGPSISGGGRFVSFESYASTFGVSDSCRFGPCDDVFLHDRDPDANGTFDEGNGVISTVSAGPDSQNANDDSWGSAVSGDGRYVAFITYATNIGPAPGAFVFDRLANTSQLMSFSMTLPSISADGRFVAFVGPDALAPNGRANGRGVFIHDRDADGDGVFDEPGAISTVRASANATGEPANADPVTVSISANGLFVAFDSTASNLVSDDTNSSSDIFTRDLRPCAAGFVNSLNGAITGVLRVNGRTDVVRLGRGQVTEFALDAAPTGPNPGRFVVWIWPTLPTHQFDFRALGQSLGCSVNPTPLTPSASPQPFRCLLGARLPAAACGHVATLRPPAPDAPWVLRRSQGFVNPITITLQGVLEDNGAANATGFSVTNAVILIVQ
ncbi:MAG: hypothetical protein HY292_18805 [Planctomycetes bacterium]|nr:hypothetical protein [Planctomycetota bacterium]